MTQAGQTPPRPSPVRVDAAGRYLLDAAGQRTFFLADTAWELFHRLTPAEVERYARTRAAQGFDAVQCVILAELDGLNEPAIVGCRPLHDNDPTRPNEAYFRHVDQVVDILNRHGLMAILLPTWGDKVIPLWGVGPAVFTPANARIYGRFVGQRYRERRILWMIGGDRPVRDENERRIWRELALGIRDAGDTHLMTFHPNGTHSSSEYVHDEPWLDFNSMQTGHTGWSLPIEKMFLADLQRRPAKPVFNSEPCYESHPVMRDDFGWRPRGGGHYTAADVRDAAWRSVFSGACAHTYGCHPVWMMYDPQRPRMNQPINYPPAAWHQQLDLPGARQVRFVRDFFLQEPDWQPRWAQDPGARLPMLQTASGRRRAMYLLADLPRPYLRDQVQQFLQDGPASSVRWFDPRTGESLTVNAGPDLNPPDPCEDWVLDIRA